MGNIIKASLHVSGRWRVAYTSEHMSGDQPLWDVSQDRAVWRFPAPPFIDDVQAAFAIATWRNALRPCTLQPGETLVEIADRWDVLSGVKLMVTEPDKACPIPETLVFDVPLVLSNGRRLWLNRFEDGVAPASPEPVPAGQLIRL